MAEPAILLAAAGWVASPLVTKLLNEGFDYLGGKGCCCLDAGIKERLEQLETTILTQFQLVIEAAEGSSEHKARMEAWLRRLKDAFYEAEDVLDLYKYQLLEEKVSDLNTRPALKPFKRVATKINAKLSIFSQIKLKTSLNKLEKIAAEAKEFREILKIAAEAKQPVATSSFPPPHEVFGRKTELDKIVEYLKSASKSEKRYSVITIVGIGGVGKTTLAQLVCEDERVINHFDKRIWVCVSRKLDIPRHTREMIESSSMEGCSLSENLDAMQKKLAELLVKSKKVLLVLDDVWWDEPKNNTEREWDTFLRPLASVESGSKVLVTTRTNNLPRALRPRPEYSMALKDLEENHILSLFKLYAFDGTNLNGSQQEKLMEIGNQIVRKLYRSSLAAKAVACQLNTTLNVDAWRSALTLNNLGDSQQAQQTWIIHLKYHPELF